MTEQAEPTRLIRGGEASTRSLLQTARRDGPSARALRAAPVAISALLAASAAEAATAAAATSAVSAALPKTSGAVLALAGKWLAVGVVAGSLASAAVTRPAAPAAKSVSPQRPLSSERRPGRVERKTPATSANTALTSAAPVVPPHAPPPLPAPRGRERSDVAREIALLDAATNALAAGAPDKALRFLDGTRSLPVRSLAPEATVLRVRALLQLGRRDAAKQLVDEFVKSAPDAPQAVVLRNLLSAPIP